MNSILGKLAVAVGVILFPIALVAALLNGVPLLTALYRAAVILFAGTVCVLVFFRFFARVLYEFVSEQLSRQEEARKKAEAQAAAAEQQAPPPAQTPPASV
ncbi:MAG: hypothetical protein JXR37_14095 [Kiritimatiellae bacterium]|nr:hypothetical protein [Kiritimatiellia bacterium]